MAINILILTDYSAPAYNAAKYALNLPTGPSNFYLLHAGTPNEMGIQNCLEKLIKEPTARGHSFHALEIPGNLIDATRKLVAEKDIDLIVMGASGDSSEHLRGLGTNTYNVLRKVKCPVLTVTEKQEFKAWENLLFPIDYSVISQNNMLGILKKLPLLAASVFNVLEINGNSSPALPVTEIRNELNIRLSPNPVKFKPVIDKTHLGGEFWKKARSGANLVVLMARNLKISDELLLHPPKSKKRLSTRPPILILHG